MAYDKEAWIPRDYASLSDLIADLDQIQAAHENDTLSAKGAWSAGQIFDHCAKPMKLAFDGFVDEQGKQIHMPLLIRIVGKLVLKPMLGRSHMKPGIKLPASASSMLPDKAISFEDGMKNLRAQLARIENGEQMTQISPLLGKMRHDQWVKMHLDHCRLHFGFIHTS
ncbi:MAG: DUF1569 domain-containing protein [Phycisphaerales bacterium]